MMVTSVWNPLGFHLLNALPKGSSFTGGYYLDNILAEVIQLPPTWAERKLRLHTDNARVHNAHKCQDFCRENGLRIILHPPYSPDLAPSDFFQFGHIKRCLARIAFVSRDELFEVIQSVVMTTPIDTLHRVFDHWMERLAWVAKNNGDYYP
jgi:histone-lysine N-methyltransferase SETMAR